MHLLTFYYRCIIITYSLLCKYVKWRLFTPLGSIHQAIFEKSLKIGKWPIFHCDNTFRKLDHGRNKKKKFCYKYRYLQIHLRLFIPAMINKLQFCSSKEKKSDPSYWPFKAFSRCALFRISETSRDIGRKKQWEGDKIKTWGSRFWLQSKVKIIQ